MQTKIPLSNNISEVGYRAQKIGFSPIVPNTTHGKVFPKTNSRMLVMSSKSPPRNTMGPLFCQLDILSYVVSKLALLHKRNSISASSPPSHQAARKRSCGDNETPQCSEIYLHVIKDIIIVKGWSRGLTMVLDFRPAWQIWVVGESLVSDKASQIAQLTKSLTQGLLKEHAFYFLQLEMILSYLHCRCGCCSY